ncbi:hypothetical protein EVAR_12924_1 [Eumeta japonica]|uniref:Uncharacterized protein n=1 Tax=Eumeta variegata TaxID=151549 RepID=A0A4C1TVS2_EUMVA|nr:hypothetical protein EVAR_12924_1 [Eumeta japonica]
MPEWKGRVPLTRSHCERITVGLADSKTRVSYKQGIIYRTKSSQFSVNVAIYQRAAPHLDAPAPPPPPPPTVDGD